MRIRIIFKSENKGAIIPFHHQHILAGIFKDIIKELDSEYADCTYTFSGVKGQTRVTLHGLKVFSNKVTVVFSSHNEKFVNALIKHLFVSPNVYQVGDLIIKPELVENELQDLHEDANKYICISPLVIINPTISSDNPKAFISPFSDQFSDYLYDSTMACMEASGLYTPEEIKSFYQFQIIPDKEYLLKIKKGEKKFARIYASYVNGEKHEVRGYTFPFTLYAHPRVHEFVFNNGLGTFTEHGFGMLDTKNNDTKKVTEILDVTELVNS